MVFINLTLFPSSTWEPSHYNWMWGQDIKDSTVGFFGFGRIGQAVAQRLQGFDIDNILYTTRNRVDAKIEKKLKASKVPFDEMLSQSDFVFIATPLTPQTMGVFNSTVFGKMKKTAVLVNFARGRKYLDNENTISKKKSMVLNIFSHCQSKGSV